MKFDLFRWLRSIDLRVPNCALICIEPTHKRDLCNSRPLDAQRGQILPSMNQTLIRLTAPVRGDLTQLAAPSKLQFPSQVWITCATFQIALARVGDRRDLGCSVGVDFLLANTMNEIRVCGFVTSPTEQGRNLATMVTRMNDNVKKDILNVASPVFTFRVGVCDPFR